MGVLTRIGIELNVSGQNKMGVGHLPGNVPAKQIDR